MATGKVIARRIFRQTLASIDIPRVMERKLPCEGSRLILPDAAIDLSQTAKVYVVAIGKAAHAMVTGLEGILPPGMRVSGIVVATVAPERRVAGMEYFVGGHPVPNAESWKSAEAILRLLKSCDERTVVIFLLSGGGSALVELPLYGEMQLEDVQGVHRALVTCGAPIEAMNTVRKHFSAVKGGRLAAAAGTTRKITLAVTDVPAGKESALASGPTLPDPSTTADVEGILAQYDLRKRFPERLVRWLDAGRMPETPKVGDPAFANAHFHLLLGVDDLFHAAHHAAETCGYATRCDNSTDDWPVAKAADALLLQLDEWQRMNAGKRVAIIADGELSSPVTGDGVGGRNSAFVLDVAGKIAGRRITVLSAGTDGIDGNSPAAGAVADGETVKRGGAAGMDCAAAFRESDAYTFFAKLDDAIVTGPTGNNLRDLRVLLAEE